MTTLDYDLAKPHNTRQFKGASHAIVLLEPA